MTKSPLIVVLMLTVILSLSISIEPIFAEFSEKFQGFHMVQEATQTHKKFHHPS